ncbi:Uncharacterized protein BP5553_06716 [Venustampulla echinocandica]|uniref:Uncharacterized protein n=1 Tax=Venustampulla echinocandica TaxID=2656787 RepID=A0A370TKR3_9HELO|nr:Uncharacterized protein BP5553_06716 [Venustampulla echinocandica]RDL36104.1 Uncharacterized protein BP5553_06716 [Venustampulla echinocandica]
MDVEWTNSTPLLPAWSSSSSWSPAPNTWRISRPRVSLGSSAGSAALTTPAQSLSNDPYDLDDPVTPISTQRQQQQQSFLRRTHIEATSAGISPPPKVRFADQPKDDTQKPIHGFEDDLGTSTLVESSSHQHSPEAARRPHRALRISKRTASAVLYALEEALRRPYPFTPDLVEENASMSDLFGGGPSASAGNGRGNNGSSRTQGAPGATGSPGIKGPTDIMRERRAREARKKAELEAKEELERARAEEEARAIEENNRRAAERRAATAAGAAAQQRAAGESGHRGSGGTTGQRISDNSQRSDRRSGGETGRPQETLQGVGRGGRAVGGGEAPPSARPRPAQSQQQSRPAQPESSRPRPPQPQPIATGAGPTGTPRAESIAPGAARSSFPHAFERWETLSAHWEGLTSFWIRRLEENSNETSRDPLSQQLSRQVTDLSAAGANLFHAVVELQRLRASSERKFQRWFFETRAEQERAQEIQAMTEASLEQERRERAAAIADAVSKERERSSADKQLAEMKRELQISKEEARRAWEELGRREQEERERTASLRDGQPTVVGGVQVVPMMPSVPSRHGSTREAPPTREEQYPAGSSGSTHEPEGPIDSDIAYQQYSRAQRAEPTDPFVEQSVPRSSRSTPVASPPATSAAYGYEYSQAPAVQPASTSAFYQQQQGTSLHPVELDPALGPSPGSEGAFSDEEYAINEEGQFIRDARGNKVRYEASVSDGGTDEYEEHPGRVQQQYAPTTSAGQGRGATTATAGRVAAPSGHPSTEPGIDYTGAGYGTGLEWGAVPRHHHPTRLSDVLEEDERSRTSASQISRGAQ